MSNFEEAYLQQPEVKFSIKLQLEKRKIGVLTIGDVLINQIVADLVGRAVNVEGHKYGVDIMSTRHYDNGVVIAECCATLAAAEEVDPEDLPVED
jgi:hypothetical protein